MNIISGSGGCCNPISDIKSMIANIEDIAINALTTANQSVQYIDQVYTYMQQIYEMLDDIQIPTTSGVNAWTEDNQVTLKDFVNSSISTNTANYISDNGQPFTSVAALPLTGITNNDYAFVTGTDAAGNTYYDRYKYSESTGSWALEYRLNNSSFTQSQWNAISSGITAAKVSTYDGYAAEIASKADEAVIRSGTLAAANWDSDTKQITITCLGVSTSSTVFIGPDPDDYLAWGNAQIRAITLGTDSITFQCETVPSSDLTYEAVIL